VQRFLILAAFFAAPILACGQTVYDAQRSPVSFSTGGSFSYFDGGYGGYHPMGLTAYVDVSPLLLDHLGAQAEGRWLTLNASDGFREYNYLIGPVYRISLTNHKTVLPYVKALVGQGDIDFPHHLAYGRYFAIAPGGGVDLSLAGRWRIRVDYEYQIWPDAPGIPGLASGTMNPNGVSLGFSYRVF
jgi:opacity protein-like surface antigen